MRILLAETKCSCVKDLGLALRGVGAIIEQTGTGEEAFELARIYSYDIIVLDLADPDSHQVVRRLRANRRETPVMMLSGLSQPGAKVRAFSLGIDDYLTKPFDQTELVARIQALVRRSKGYSQPTLHVGPMRLNLDNREVLVNDQVVPLTGKEYAILELLVLRKGSVLTKDMLLSHLYNDMDEPDAKIIDVFVCKLRKKLAQAGADTLIGTVWGRGYMIREPGHNIGAQPADNADVRAFLDTPA